MAPKMHADELETDVGLVRCLLAAQFPDWAPLPIEPVQPRGTDNALYRLGDELVARLPRIHWAVGGVAKDMQWLPLLAPLLPVAIPVPVAKGEPAEGYPWEWGVYPWLEGETLTVDGVSDAELLATDLARFVKTLQHVPLTGGPHASRGAPLAERDDATRDSIAALRGAIDTDAVTAVWDEALAAPEWRGPRLWVHGDLDPRNLLVQHGRMSAVIDWGGLGTGDPACDVAAAWKVTPPATRDLFRTELSVDDATWARSRGWTVMQCVNALSYYTLETNAVLVHETRRWLAELLASAV
jgi:aminoglycoside phosphotransferase (APT) family kinase protein